MTARTESAGHDTADGRTGMVDAMLEEVLALLGRFVETGEPASIDMRGLPLSAADRADLEEALGQGEVSAVLTVAGRSEAWETAVSGVWWVRHLGANGGTAAEQIVITRVPEILATDPDDVRDGLLRLRDTLDNRRAAREGRISNEATEDAA